MAPGAAACSSRHRGVEHSLVRVGSLARQKSEDRMGGLPSHPRRTNARLSGALA